MLHFFKRVWPLGASALLGFFIAIVLFLPELSARNKNAYRILKTKMKVLEQIISFVNHFYFDQVDFDKIMDGSFRGLMEELDPSNDFDKATVDVAHLAKAEIINVNMCVYIYI